MCGARVLDEWSISSALLVRLCCPVAGCRPRLTPQSPVLAQAVVQNKASSVQSKEHALFTIELLCTRLGPAFEPYMLLLMPTVLASISDTQATVREAAEAAALAIASNIAAQGVSLIMPSLLEAMGDRHASSCATTQLPLLTAVLRRMWKKKETSLQLLALLAKRAPHQVGRAMPAAIPKLMECLQDTHPKVSAAAAAALADVASVITQPEIQKNMSTLIEALSKPEQKTAACLEKV